MKLFLKISNLCNHNTSTLRTDRQTDKPTDGQTTCHSNTALCVASRGKNGWNLCSIFLEHFKCLTDIIPDNRLPCQNRQYCVMCDAVRIFEISNQIVTSVFELIQNKYNYSKFLNTYHHQFFIFLTEWRRFFTLATMPSSQQSQCYIGPLWPTKYWNSYNRNHNSAVP